MQKYKNNRAASTEREPQTVEHQRLIEPASLQAGWKNWGPYLSDRAWGTVREDYRSDGTAWEYFPHEHACNGSFP